MPNQKPLSLAREARERAQRKSLAKVETFTDAWMSRQKMREIAVKYEELAERLEHAAAH
jgi:hypothetical protein